MPESTGAPAAAPTGGDERSGSLRAAAELSSAILLAVGSVGSPERIELSEQEEGRALAVEFMSIDGIDGRNGGAAASLSLLVVPVPRSGVPDLLLTDASGSRLEISGEDLDAAGTDLKTLVRRHLAPLDADTRNEVVEFLAAAVLSQSAAVEQSASAALFALREGLRERLQLPDPETWQTRGAAIDSLLAVDQTAFCAQGWAFDSDAPIVRLTIVSPEGCRTELWDARFALPRRDVLQHFDVDADDEDEKAGFVCFFELSAPSRLSEGWVLEMENEDGTQIETGVPGAIRDVPVVREALLDDPVRERHPDDELMANHIMPALTRMQHDLAERIEVDSVTEFGTPPENPEISVIVPLYKRIDHVEVQLSQFADDPRMQDADLIYVLDSPEQRDELLDLSAELHLIYRVPFRVAVLERNVGFAGANNAGASLARGRLLMLMNSDVIPKEAGWMEALSDFHDRTPDLGVVGPKLLYEDDSIQHAGMYYFQAPGTSLWLDSHYYKGMHRSFSPANVTRPVPAVSGACVMIARERYEELGGLGGVYVRGDYEDFDLCLRLRAQGFQSWYLPEVELYHLEAQSYTPDLRMPANRYNMWLHTHLWGDTIAEMMEALPGPEGEG